MIANNKIYLCSDETVTFDPYYRYRIDMPQYEIKTKKGAHVTYFKNSESFAKSIETDHNLLTKIIGNELSCKSEIDKEHGCATFKGLYDITKINNIILELIQKYLLCQSCDKPEIVLYKKKGKLRQKCKACGEKHYISEQFESTNMYEYIYKHI